MSGDVPQLQVRSRLRRILDVARLVVGLAGLFVAAWLVGVASNGLPHVPSVDHRVYESTQSIEMKVATILVMALCMAIVTGVWVVGRVDLGQLLAALWVGFWLFALVWLLYSVQFSGPDAVCTFTSCWPAPFQELMVAAPVALAAIGMAVLAMGGQNPKVWVRAVIPALLLLILTLIQHIIWRSVVLAILLGPPQA